MASSTPFFRFDEQNVAGGEPGGDCIRGGGIGSLRPSRPFVRMQSSERSWSDRNGTDHEWGGGSGQNNSVLGTSPRKDFGRGFDSWRRQGRNAGASEQDDEPPASGGWRTSNSKWSSRSGGNNWRNDSEPTKDGGGWSVPRSNSNSWGEDHGLQRGGHPHPHQHAHRPWDPPHNHPAAHGADCEAVSGPLPEWATESPSESRGSFDASGAFHGGTPLSDDEDGSGGNHSTSRGHRRPALVGEGSKTLGSPHHHHHHHESTCPEAQNSVTEVSDRVRRQPLETSRSALTESEPSRSVNSRRADQPGSVKDEPHRTLPQKLPSPPALTPTSSNMVSAMLPVRCPVRPDEEMDRMREVADDLVAKLMEDEDHRTGAAPPPPTSVAASTPPSEKWYYRDPQGDVQGPFSSSEMLDWFRLGYFNLTLLVRRACDERYSSLGDIMKLWGRLPFIPGGPPVPPIKADTLPPVSSVAMPPLMPPPMPDLLSDSHSHSLLMQQYQYSMLQRQLLLGQQAAVQAAARAAIGELSQTDRWASLSPVEQRRLVTERLALQQMLGLPSLVPPVSVPPPSVVDLFSVPPPGQQPPGPPQPPPPQAQPPHTQPPVSATNPVAQLISQMQMLQGALPPKEPQSATTLPVVDQLQQLFQQMGSSLPPASSAATTAPASSQPLGGVGLDSDGPGRTLLQTLNAGKVASVPSVDSVWGGSVPAGYGLGVGAAVPWVATSTASAAGQVPLSLWDLAQQQGKDVKTEQQVLEEQLRAEEERRLEEQRKIEEEEAVRKQKEQQEKQEEEKRQKEEEEREKKRQQDEEEERKKKKQLEEEERKKKKQQEEEEKRRKKQQEEEEKKRKKQQEEEEKRRKKEEERRQRELEEEEKRRKREEAERQQREEEECERKKKQQEAKKIEEAMKKEKEKAAQKREEEKKRKEAEKEKKKKAEEARKKEEEEKKKQEEEVRARQRRQEQQQEALRRLQEQQEKARQAAALRPAPWTAAPVAPAVTAAQQPLTEIQRQERERERQQQLQLQQQLQQQQQQQQQQQNASTAAQNSTLSSNGSGLQLRWAEVKPPVPVAKSLSEIQQEEQEQLAKQQQLERERLQQQQQQQQQVVATPTVAMASIWGSASQSLSWATSVSTTTPASPWGNTNSTTASSGFWEDAAKASTAIPVSKSRSATNHNNNIINNNSNSSGNNKNVSGGTNAWKAPTANTKARSKKDEAVVMKLFEPRPDEFTQWCTEALGSLKHSIDVPTFVTFLRDIESVYEVKEYVRVYLGEGHDVQEFSKQFLERRSRLQQQKAVRDHTPEDDLSTPAPTVMPSQEFHEVKGKGKKAKKNRMHKVDNRILGFNVTAAQDRLNVGERDLGDSM